MLETGVLWDAIVIGAGPAGAVGAALLARRGWRVLLLEKRKWPREKACGGCLNAAGMRMLRQIGMGRAIENARAVNRFEVHVGGESLDVAMPEGCVVNRAAFDAALVDEATRCGATFVPECAARVSAEYGPFRKVLIGKEELRARIVLVCDGVRGNALGWHGWALWESPRGARVGISATVAGSCREDAIAMYVGAAGYVGLVRQSHGSVHVGAAVDPRVCSRLGPRETVAEILRECGVELELADAELEGTGPLTGKRRALAQRRVMIVGDACGYVEPFTGEGMSWAIGCAIAAARLLPADLTRWPEEFAERWEEAHAREVAGRQRWCKGLRQIVKRPRLARAGMFMAQVLPWAPAYIARRIGA